MPQDFFDTSATVKYYHLEPGSAAVSAIFAEPSHAIRISTLGLLEMQSALAMKIRAGALTPEAAGIQRARLMLDIAAGDIEVYGVTEDHFAVAERLIGKHASSHRLRTLDALQLGVALDLFGQGLLDQFVFADRDLASVAKREGLGIVDPGEQ